MFWNRILRIVVRVIYSEKGNADSFLIYNWLKNNLQKPRRLFLKVVA
jgi:hypothetical protein